jgi:Fe-S cluster biosynthesis and repair protein YggX
MYTLKSKVSVKEFREKLELLNIEVENGKVYSMYTCGHIVERSKDLDIKKTLPNAKGQSRPQKICPICWKEFHTKNPLLIKYKKCLNCEEDRVGKKLVAGKKCLACCKPSPLRTVFKNSAGTYERTYNEEKRDVTRWKCIHRKECLEKYEWYSNIPCKECKRYKTIPGYFY